MFEQAAQAIPRSVEHLAHAAPPQLHAQRQGIDEHADRVALDLDILQASGQHGTKHHVVAAGQLGQDLRPRHVEQRRGRGAVAAGGAAHALAQRGAQQMARLGRLRAVSLHIGQAERHGGTGHVAQLAAEIRLVQRRRHRPGTRHEVTVWQGRRQLAAFAAQDGLHFGQHDVERDVIASQVMDQDGEVASA